MHHSKSMHIEIRHHFIKDHVAHGIYIEFVSIENQFVDIFTKPLDKSRFEFLRNEIGMFNPFY